MLDEDSNPKDKGGPKKPSGNGFDKIPVFTLLAWAAIIAATVGLFMMKNHYATPPVTLTQSEFLNKFQSNQIAHATINLGGQSSMLTPISGTFYQTNGLKPNSKPVEIAFTSPNAYLTQKMLDQLLPSGVIEAGCKSVIGLPVGLRDSRISRCASR